MAGEMSTFQNKECTFYLHYEQKLKINQKLFWLVECNLVLKFDII